MFFVRLHFPACCRTQHAPPQSSDANSVNFRLPSNPTTAVPTSMVSSQLYPLSLSTQSSYSAEPSMPHFPSQPVSVSSEPQILEPQSEVDVALRILSSSSSLQTESARVMPLPGYGLSMLGFSGSNSESSSVQVEFTAILTHAQLPVYDTIWT